MRPPIHIKKWTSIDSSTSRLCDITWDRGAYSRLIRYNLGSDDLKTIQKEKVSSFIEESIE